MIVRRQPHPPPRPPLGDTHLFLTSIVPMGRNHLEVDAAVVKVDTVRQMAEREAVVQTFPGCSPRSMSGTARVAHVG